MTQYELPHSKLMKLKKQETDLVHQALRKTEERYQRMIAEISDYAIFSLSPDGIIQDWNKGAEKIKGYSANEIVGKSFKTFYLPEDQKSKLPERLLEEARKTGRAANEGWRLRKNGTKFWGSVVITAIHDDDENVIGFTKVTRDLTERKYAEDKQQKNNEELTAATEELTATTEELTAATEELQEINAELVASQNQLQEANASLKASEQRYHRMIAEVSDYAIVLLSREGIIENWNKGAEHIKGYAAGEIVGKSFKEFYTKEDLKNKLPETLLERARKEGKARHEGWRVRKDGSKFWSSVVITALHDENNKIIGFSKVTRDLTERKLADDKIRENTERLEQQNKELERMNQELTSFAYVSSHDLQEPLRKIQTFITRITETEVSNLTEKGKDYFTRIQNAANRMQVLIDDLLTYSRTNTDQRKVETTDLNVILSEVKSDLREKIDEKQVEIKSTKLPTLDVIAFQFRQLLINLIGNSMKFSKQGVAPKIEIKSDVISGNEIPDHKQLPDKKYHHITLTDNGIGFEPEYNQKIFEVFQRLHGRSEYSGTGIGLAICKKIVENHNGFIRAEGTPDVGATFHIYLPETK